MATARFNKLPARAKRAAFANMAKKSKNRGKGSMAYSTMEDRRRKKGRKAKRRTTKRKR